MHIPKCAGSTVEHWMAEALDADGWRADPQRNVPFKLRETGFGEAMNLHPDYFWFSYVRSTFSRFISLWQHSNRGEGNYFTRPEISSPHRYMEILLSGKRELLSGFDRLHHKPQALYLPQCDGKVFDVVVGRPLDFIGRVEHFDEDYLRLCASIGRQPQVVKKKQLGRYVNGLTLIDRDLFEMI